MYIAMNRFKVIKEERKASLVYVPLRIFFEKGEEKRDHKPFSLYGTKGNEYKLAPFATGLEVGVRENAALTVPVRKGQGEGQACHGRWLDNPSVTHENEA